MLSYDNLNHAMFLRNVRENLLKAIEGTAMPRPKGQDLVDAKVQHPKLTNTHLDFTVERPAFRQFLMGELHKVETELQMLGVEIRGKESA